MLPPVFNFDWAVLTIQASKTRVFNKRPRGLRIIIQMLRRAFCIDAKRGIANKKEEHHLDDYESHCSSTPMRAVTRRAMSFGAARCHVLNRAVVSAQITPRNSSLPHDPCVK